MITNINTLSENTELQSDICIIGAGAAGITLAMELNMYGLNITLIEGGGFEFPTKEEGSELYDGLSIGRDYQVKNSRLRFFGGTTNHWGGWCRPLDGIDFLSKPDLNVDGWPFSKNSLSKYYNSAAEICEIPNYNNYQENFEGVDSALNLDQSSSLTNKFFVFSPPTRFGSRYRDNIENSNNIRCFLYANATELITEHGVSKGVIAKSLKGNTLKISCGKTILAMGGIENARFLLLNSLAYRKNGIPNKNGLIGKYFMDHPGMSPASSLLPKNLKYYRHSSDKGVIMPVLSLSEKTILNKKLSNIALLFNPAKEDSILTNDFLTNPFIGQFAGGSMYSIQAILEPTPYIKSEVILDDQKDELNQRKVKLNWQINPKDFEIAEKSLSLISRELTKFGRFKFIDNYIEKTIKSSGYGMHHLGTTKMGSSPKNSVVNSNCEMHEIKNLFIAGSSVFPTAGFSNPTLTITALSVRLAEYLSNG